MSYFVIQSLWTNNATTTLQFYRRSETLQNPETQSTFLKGHSCENLLLKFKDDVTKAMKNGGEVTQAVAVDYSKALTRSA